MTPFAVPKGSTVESLIEGMHMQKSRRVKLIDDDRGVEPSPYKSLLGGFLPMPKCFLCDEGVAAVARLAIATGRNFRAPTRREGLAYKKSAAIHPDYWIILDFSEVAFYWFASGGYPEFYYLGWKEIVVDSACQILIVEDVGDLIP